MVFLRSPHHLSKASPPPSPSQIPKTRLSLWSNIHQPVSTPQHRIWKNEEKKRRHFHIINNDIENWSKYPGLMWSLYIEINLMPSISVLDSFARSLCARSKHRKGFHIPFAHHHFIAIAMKIKESIECLRRHTDPPPPQLWHICPIFTSHLLHRPQCKHNMNVDGARNMLNGLFDTVVAVVVPPPAPLFRPLTSPFHASQFVRSIPTTENYATWAENAFHDGTIFNYYSLFDLIFLPFHFMSRTHGLAADWDRQWNFSSCIRLKSGVSKNATNCVAAVVGGRKWKIPKYKVYYVPQFAKFTEFGCWLIIFWLRSRCYRISVRAKCFCDDNEIERGALIYDRLGCKRFQALIDFLYAIKGAICSKCQLSLWAQDMAVRWKNIISSHFQFHRKFSNAKVYH